VQVFRQMNATNVRNSRAPRNRGLDREQPAAPSKDHQRAHVSEASVLRSLSTQAKAPVSRLAVFIARAEARAMLWQCGELDLDEAVDVLQAASEASGLIEEIGQDAVQAIIAKAFEAVR